MPSLNTCAWETNVTDRMMLPVSSRTRRCTATILSHALATGLLASALASPCHAGAIVDEIYGDGFDGFDASVCDSGLSSNSQAPDDYARALDLCQKATESGHAPGLISAAFTLASGAGIPATASHAIRPAFGTNNTPRHGAALVVLSTGAAAAPGDLNPAYQAFDPGVDNGTLSDVPADWLAANANAIPHAPGCPEPHFNYAIDPVMLTLRIRTPSNARSFALDANFFTVDYAEFVCSPFNDMFVALLDSAYTGTPANPDDKNLATYTMPTLARYPLDANLARDATGLFTQCVNGTTGCSSQNIQTMSACTGTSGLVGTGLDVATPNRCDADSLRGGATGWLTLRGNVLPGEIITLRLAIWDTSDYLEDSAILLDHLRWSASSVTAGTFAQQGGESGSPQSPPRFRQDGGR